MQVARVIGDVVATRKDPALHGLKLLVLQPLDMAKQAVGRPLVAADAAGAGTGELVFFVRGREAAFPFYPAEPPVDAAIVGIVDPARLWKRAFKARRVSLSFLSRFNRC